MLFCLCMWDIYEVPDAHYTGLMRNNPWEVLIQLIAAKYGAPSNGTKASWKL